jgi:hypothetical protein
MLDRANSFRLDIREHEQLLAFEGRIRTVLAAVQVDGEEEGPREPAGVDQDEDEDEREGEDEGEDEDEDERQGEDEGEDEDGDVSAEEEMWEVVMRALAEELRKEVEVELERIGRVEKVEVRVGTARREILFIVNDCRRPSSVVIPPWGEDGHSSQAPSLQLMAAPQGPRRSCKVTHRGEEDGHGSQAISPAPHVKSLADGRRMAVARKLPVFTPQYPTPLM